MRTNIRFACNHVNSPSEENEKMWEFPTAKDSVIHMIETNFKSSVFIVTGIS